MFSLISLAGERGQLEEMKSLLPTETHFLGDMCGWVEQPWMPLKESQGTLAGLRGGGTLAVRVFSSLL